MLFNFKCCLITKSSHTYLNIQYLRRSSSDSVVRFWRALEDLRESDWTWLREKPRLWQSLSQTERNNQCCVWKDKSHIKRDDFPFVTESNTWEKTVLCPVSENQRKRVRRIWFEDTVKEWQKPLCVYWQNERLIWETWRDDHLIKPVCLHPSVTGRSPLLH